MKNETTDDIIEIYRGDSIINFENTSERSEKIKNLEQHVDGGIIANSALGGDVYSVYKSPIDVLIKNHIDPEVHAYTYKTDFLSFTSEHNIAKKYSFGKDVTFEMMYSSQTYDNDNYTNLIFVIDIGQKVKSDIEGFYWLDYKCDRNEEFCWHCSKFQNYKHKLLVIDCVSYINKNYKSNMKVALRNATRDKEWLILPFDPLPEYCRGLNSKIQTSNIWTVEYYQRT